MTTKSTTEPNPADVPKDFKLAPVGSKDYVAGQPVDEAEFEKTQKDAAARVAHPGAPAAKAAHGKGAHNEI